ncbi:MAG: BamA/TamA family outer membrane protein, partial [Gemmatimonadota bacterium]
RWAAQRALEQIGSGLGGDTVTYVMLPSRTSHWSPRGRRTVRYLVPADRDVLSTSPELPPPIWQEEPGFISPGEIQEMTRGLATLPSPPPAVTPYTFRWGLQRPDLVRYNRVEGLSLGARGQIRPSTPLGPLSLTATVRLGSGDLHPEARLDVTRETLEHRFTWSVFHELAAVDADARHLQLGNSLTALLFGRDDGDYYRRTGTWLEWTPPSAERRSFRVRAYGEYEQPVRPWTDFSFWHLARDDASFRDNLTAQEGWELGARVDLSPWWGTDPRSLQGGVDVTVQAAGGDFHYARTSATGRLAVPLPGDLRVGLVGAAGTSWGDPPPQRLWLMGGAATLRGYAPRTLTGTSFGRGRAEVGRLFSFGTLSLFSDVAWAGDRAAVRWDDALYSAGAGISLVDGLIRMDGAWGLRSPRGFRLELYLDGIL